MNFVSSTRAAENSSRWKGIVANSSVVPRRPPKVMGLNRIEGTSHLLSGRVGWGGGGAIIM